MAVHQVKLNEDKTDIILIGTWQQLNKVNIAHLNIGNERVPTVSSAICNLGSCFDSNLKMTTQINKTCQSVFYHLHNIRRITKFLSNETTKLLVQAMIMARIDYCNGLLYGVPAVHLSKLQRLQNTAVRLITYTPRNCHITPVLHALLWLPVMFRICYKIAVITFKAIIYNLAPVYLRDLINIGQSSRYNMRTDTGIILQDPTVKFMCTLGTAHLQQLRQRP